MKIIYSNNDGSQRVAFAFNLWLHFVIPTLFLTTAMGFVLVYKSDGLLIRKQTETVNQRAELHVLALRMAALEAESLRLNTFSSHIVKVAKFDPDEFSFGSKPPLGGLSATMESESEITAESNEMTSSILQLESDLKKQRERLEKMLGKLNGRIQERQALPTSKPTRQGYISSAYGMRRDPFSGKKRMHQGIDIAAEKGTTVYAMGNGVVAYVGKKGGYGTMVDIRHGSGLVSRYAHLSKTLVNIGEVVKRDSEIGEIGNTGRSTGPHLHLEILKNGEQQNPADYLGK